MSLRSDFPEAPVLWHFRISHYSEKVRWALDFKRWPHVRMSLIPGFHIPVARWLSGQNRLPITRLGGKIVAGSNHILAEIERLRPDPPLFPGDAAGRTRALALQAYFDEQVAPDLRRIAWSTYIDDPAAAARMATNGSSGAARCVWRAVFPVMRPALRRNMQINSDTVRASRGRIRAHFDYLAREIGPSGFLVGDSFSVADLTAAAVMTVLVWPPEFPYPPPDPRPRPFAALRDTVTDHDAFKWVQGIYSRYRGRSWAQAG